MTFNKKLLTVAVGSALTFGLAVPQAMADNALLAPYVVKDGTNRTTVVSVMGTVTASPGLLHLQYWSKPTSDANTAACQPNSITIPFTPNDIVTFDTGGILGYPLFGDTTNGLIAPSMAGSGSRHGYLVAGADTSVDNFNAYAGYWLELDLANGGASGDAMAHFDTLSGGSTISNAMVLRDGDTGGYDTAGQAVNFWPANIATQVFTVTPVGSTAAADSMNNTDNHQVVVQVRDSAGIQGFYDRNETHFDGTAPVAVRCVGRVTMGQLFPLVSGSFPLSTMGGWGWLTNLGNNNGAPTACSTGTNGDCNAIVYQVDSASLSGKFAVNATRIATDDGTTVD